jgi:exosortase
MTGLALSESPRHSEIGSVVNWSAIGWVSVLIGLCYAPVLGGLFHQWHANEDMGHGLFVPLFAIYIVWERRSALSAAIADDSHSRSRTVGLVLIVWAFIQLVVALLAAELYLQRTAFLISVAGVILYLGGIGVFRLVAFPLALMLFSIPLPGIFLKSVTFPLQLLSSQLAEWTLDMAGYTVLRDGNILELAGQQLSVAEACSGIRAILSLAFFSICYAYLMESRLWVRLVLFSATIPVAVIANAGRVVLIGVLGEIDRKLASGFLHTASGWVIFVISVAMLLLVHRIMTAIWPDPAEAMP